MKKILAILLLLIPFIVVGFVDPYARRIRPFTSVPSSCAENEIGYSMTLHTGQLCTNTGYHTILTSGGAGFVTSVFGRSGAVVAATNDYNFNQLAGTATYSQLTLTGAILNTDLAGSIAYSKLILTNSIVSGDIVSLVWSKITSTPTTIGGYGITDFNSLGDARWLKLSGGTLTGNLLFTDNTLDIGASGATRPRTGYFGTSLISPLFNGLAITNNGTNTLNISAGKTLNVSNILTLTATDNSTLAIGTGGTLGTNAYTSTTYAPIASPTFTGTVTIPTPFTLGAISVTSTGTQLNYLSAATGTTGTNTSNLVYSISPLFTGNPTFGINDWPSNTITKNGNRVIINDIVNPYLLLDNSAATPAANSGGEIYLGSRAQVGAATIAYARILGYKVNATDANYLSGLKFYLLDSGGSEINILSLSSTGVTINGGTEVKKHLSSTATLDFGNLAAIGCENLTMTVTGAALGDTVDIGVPNASIVTNGNFFGWVSAADTVSIKFCTVISGDPASGTFRADVWQH